VLIACFRENVTCLHIRKINPFYLATDLTIDNTKSSACYIFKSVLFQHFSQIVALYLVSLLCSFVGANHSCKKYILQSQNTFPGAQIHDVRNMYPDTVRNEEYGSILEEAFNNEECDPNYTIQFNDNISVRVHRFVLCAASPVLKALVKNGMKETASGVAKLDDNSSIGVPVFRFLYSGKLVVNSFEDAMSYLSFSNKYALLKAENFISELICSNIDLRIAFRLKDCEFERLSTAAQKYITNIPIISLSGGKHKYQGTINNGLLQGFGILTYEDGSTYAGDFWQNKPHGKGIIISATGDHRYEGDFVHGKMHGVGVTTTSDGKRHEGLYENNKTHGKGVSIHQGARYEGNWRDGMLDGYVLFTDQSGVVFDQLWKDDTLVKSIERIKYVS
jgi:hypothetical protein